MRIRSRSARVATITVITIAARCRVSRVAARSGASRTTAAIGRASGVIVVVAVRCDVIVVGSIFLDFGGCMFGSDTSNIILNYINRLFEGARIWALVEVLFRIHALGKRGVRINILFTNLAKKAEE